MENFIEINSAKQSLLNHGVIDIRIYADTVCTYLMDKGEICLASYEFKNSESATIDKAIKYLYIEAVEKGLFS